MRLSQEDKRKIVQLVRSGKRAREVAHEYGVATGTVHNLVWEYKGRDVQMLESLYRILCDHSTSKCQCVNNSKQTYRDYLQNAGYKLSRDQEIRLPDRNSSNMGSSSEEGEST